MKQTSRIRSFPPPRTPLLLAARDFRALELPVLLEAALVADRRRVLLPIRRPPQVMDHPYADHHRHADAVYLNERAVITGYCQSARIYFRFSLF